MRSASTGIVAGATVLIIVCDAAAAAAQATGWERSVQISGNAWYGAAHARVMAAEVALARTDSTLSARTDLHAAYADDRAGDEPRRVTARAMKTTVSVDYRPLARYSPFAFGSLETSLQQRIAQRLNVGVGAKLTVLHHARDDASVSLAILAERTRPLVPPDSLEPIDVRARWSLRARYRRQLTPTLFFSHVTFYQPRIDDVARRFTVDATTAVEAALSAALALTSTLHHHYDSEARSRGADSNTDGQLLLGLRARF